MSLNCVKIAMLVTAVMPLAVSASLVTWPCAEKGEHSPFEVKVNERPVEVLSLPAPTHCLSGDNAHSYSAVFFDASGEVEVEVTGAVQMRDVRILPTSREVRPEVTGERSMRFRATPPFALAVEPTGRHNALIVSANVPERDPPKDGDPNVIYFGPGRHRRDVPIRIGSNQTLYLAPGAYVEGSVLAQGTNITVCGRGILSGAPWPWCNGPAPHMSRFMGKDITVRDVTLMSSWGWCLVIDKCDRATVDNVKILNGRVLNDDGIDVCHSRRVTIRNCFIRTQDDCITPKWWCEDLLVENCTLWADVANIFRIGYECRGKDRPYRNLTFRGIDVLHQSILKAPSSAYWSENAICIQPANDQLFENILFEKMRFDAPEPGDLFMTVRTFTVDSPTRKDKEAGRLKGLTVRDVHFPEPLAGHAMGVRLESKDENHRVEDVTFENVTGCGPLAVEGDVRNVKIPSTAFARREPVTEWPQSRGWTSDGGVLTASGEAGTIRTEHAWARGGVVTARLTPERLPADPASGTTFGLRFEGPEGYWGLSFWRHNGAASRRLFEFEEKRGGKRSANTGLTRLYRRNQAGWAPGKTYLFSLRLTETLAEAAVFDEQSGREVFAEAYVFPTNGAVVVGRPTFYSWGGTAGTVRDVTWTSLGANGKESRSLFNGKDLTNWYTYLQGHGKNNDPKGVFTVTNGVIHVTGEEFGALVSEEEFSNYHLSLEYRFLGGRQYGWKVGWAPDSGILFHSTGPDGGFGDKWMESIEVNLIKGATGDFWGVGAKGSDRIALSACVGKSLLEDKYCIFDPKATDVYTITGNTRVCRRDISREWRDRTDVAVAANEKPIGAWNRVDLYCVGGDVLVAFNGKYVNRGFDARPTRGRLQLQSEGCAVEFRNICIAPRLTLPVAEFR